MRTPGLRPVIIYPYEGAMLKPEQVSHDLGIVPTDAKIAHTFNLYNTGGKYLRIYNVETSCGCTAATLKKKHVAPGDYTKLSLILDTSTKLGPIKKTIDVFSNDPKHPVYRLYLTGTAVRQMGKGHAFIEPKDRLALFKGECASCHVAKGKGKSGEALFAADCAMCHGFDASGREKIAPGLISKDLRDEAVLATYKRVIAEGSPRTPQMPPFSKLNGGPLTDGEIDSLLAYLKYRALLQHVRVTE